MVKPLAEEQPAHLEANLQDKEEGLVKSKRSAEENKDSVSLDLLSHNWLDHQGFHFTSLEQVSFLIFF